MGTILTVVVVIGLVFFAIKMMSNVVAVARLLSEAEKKQIRDAVLINFGGPYAASVIDQKRQLIHRRNHRPL